MLSRFSYSSLGTFRNCPQQFKFEKIDKVKVPRRLYAFTHLGNAVHRQLKTAYQWAADGKLYPLETMLERYESDWEAPLKQKIIPAGEHLTVDDSIESGRQMLTTYFNRYQPFDQGILLGAEMTLNFELPGTRFPFTARFDRLLKREDGAVEICDYKTARQLPAGGINSPGFKRQMGLYQLAVQAAYPQLEQIELAHYYLKHNEVISHRLRPDELDELTEQFRTDVLATVEAERLNDWPAKESGLCNFCDYAHICPIGLSELTPILRLLRMNTRRSRVRSGRPRKALISLSWRGQMVT
ncbi:MAG: RecB family exonuclease [Planctomycetota bacterium]|jgi:putative RecB family exonuclease